MVNRRSLRPTPLLFLLLCCLLSACQPKESVHTWLPDGVAPYYDPSTGMKFVLIPGGCFQMGDIFHEGRPVEQPVHEVCVSDFYMGSFEVTQKEFMLVMGQNPSFFSRGDEYPVEMVSWDDVHLFIERLNSRSKTEYRLPTEAEWEFAARDGGRLVRYGNGKNTITKGEANIIAVGENTPIIPDEFEWQTTRVGSFPPNQLGLHDMSGNVWEWCSDWYDHRYHQSGGRDNPTGPISGTWRVRRGGGWGVTTFYARAATRNATKPDERHNYLGFRLVFPLQER